MSPLIQKGDQLRLFGISAADGAYPVKTNHRRKGADAMAFSNQEILARIIQCEAGGEGENGMKAVACVVMNRVNVTYGEYGRLEPTIRAVVYQEGQFDCVRESIRGQYNPQNIYNMRPEQVHYDIANWAIAGNRLTNLGYALWYFNPFVPTCRQNFPSSVGRFVIRIGDHCFYNPTEAYAAT
jgi:N-acetylmuramoyl-L-alanine amidase